MTRHASRGTRRRPKRSGYARRASTIPERARARPLRRRGPGRLPETRRDGPASARSSRSRPAARREGRPPGGEALARRPGQGARRPTPCSRPRRSRDRPARRSADSGASRRRAAGETGGAGRGRPVVAPLRAAVRVPPCRDAPHPRRGLHRHHLAAHGGEPGRVPARSRADVGDRCRRVRKPGRQALADLRRRQAFVPGRERLGARVASSGRVIGAGQDFRSPHGRRDVRSPPRRARAVTARSSRSRARVPPDLPRRRPSSPARGSMRSPRPARAREALAGRPNNLPRPRPRRPT